VWLLEERVLVTVRGRTAAEEAERGSPGGANRVPCAGRDERRVTWPNKRLFAVELELTFAFDDVVDLFGFRVVVPRGGRARAERRLGQALVSDGRCRQVQE
jgi:hypothetical protein